MRCRLPSAASKGKASDSNGTRTEDFKAREKTKEMVRQVFNEVLSQDNGTPTTWRRLRIKVIHKKVLTDRE